MGYWPFWAGGAALATVAIAHQGLLRTRLGVSGKLTALVDRTFRKEPEMDDAAMVEALRAMTLTEFGEDAVAAPPESSDAAMLAPRQEHGSFFVGVVLGAAVVAIATGRFAPTLTMHGTGFAETYGHGAKGIAALLVGGLLVGFGTRMAGGCTSGHGLVGVSRLERGSLVATACFFGAGIAASFVLEMLR